MDGIGSTVRTSSSMVIGNITGIATMDTLHGYTTETSGNGVFIRIGGTHHQAGGLAQASGAMTTLDGTGQMVNGYLRVVPGSTILQLILARGCMTDHFGSGDGTGPKAAGYLKMALGNIMLILTLILQLGITT